MLCNSFGRQQAARCCQHTSYSLHGRNSIQLQRRLCTVLQRCRSPELTKVVSPLVRWFLLLVLFVHLD